MRCILLLTLITFLSSSYLLSQSLRDSVRIEKWNPTNELISRLNNEHIIFKGGLIIKPKYWTRKQFGGLSSLWVIDGGESFFTISDYGNNVKEKFQSKWYQFNLEFDLDRNLTGVELIRQGNMYDSNGIINGGIESIAFFRDSTLYIGFDKLRYLLHYEFDDTGSINVVDTVFIVCKKDFPDRYNAGIEALTNAGDSLLAIYEVKGVNKDYYEAWLIDPVKKISKSLLYNGFADISNKDKTNPDILKEIKGATTLKDGNIIILEKLFNMKDKSSCLRFVLVKLQEIDENILNPITLFSSGFSKALDNFEGIGSYISNGNQYLLLISDDNGSKGQKTLLLNFEILNK